MTPQYRRANFRSYLARDPVILAVLSGLAIMLFLGVTGLSGIYHRQQESLGTRWANRGRTDLDAHRFDVAALEFRTALFYSRDKYAYQLGLAEALLGLKKSNEAGSYLLNLWDRQPENGWVNLELARVSVAQGRTEDALRYYHNAIYAIWPGDQEVRRSDARLELIEFLLHSNEKAGAQSELIALSANARDGPAQQTRFGDLFFKAQDYEHALAWYRLSLTSDRHNPPALAGAGLAAFELGRYAPAQRYLQAAVGSSPGDSNLAAKLETANLVLQMDPFRQGIPSAERNRTVVDDFAAAGKRLTSCSANATAEARTTPAQNLAAAWTKLKPRITERGLIRNPDLVNTATELVFHIERQANGSCGPPTDADTALLLIAKLREGN